MRVGKALADSLQSLQADVQANLYLGGEELRCVTTAQV
jgi:hypothetical protein